MSLLQTVTFFSFWALGLGVTKLEQSQVSVSTQVTKSVDIHCRISSSQFEPETIHWYLQKPNQTLEHLIQITSTRAPAQTKERVMAKKDASTVSSILTINRIQKEDEAVYYCAGWGRNLGKIFGGGTKLIVIDKVFDEDISPKPSMFLPSVSETHTDKAGTYLCLLEEFFPENIKVHWKERDNDGDLESRQSDTVKVNSTYMKFSWLTVTGDSMSKEHTFIVKHENNKGNVDQKIVFPPIKKVTSDPEACLKYENGLRNLQLANTSAYYIYLLLLLKSALHGAFITFRLCRWSALCVDRKSF